MYKHLLIAITCLHISNIKASGKNDELMAMLHSPVKTAELKRSLEHPHFRGIFVEQAPQTPVRGAQFFQKKAKSHLKYVMAYSAAHATALHQDAKKLYERLPEGESPQRKPTLKDSLIPH